MKQSSIFPLKLLGDCRETLKSLPDCSVHCAITSIPYWGLRSYLPADHPLKPLEIGSESSFALYLDHLSEAFAQVRRALRDDGTLWLNCGDAYSNDTKWGGKSGGKNYTSSSGGYKGQRIKHEQGSTGLKPKDLLMMPARVAMRLQADGWYLRSMIPWVKRNAMPESVTDRPTTAVEYVFLFSKSQDYFYDKYAVMMPSSDNTHPRVGRDGSFKANRVTDETLRDVNPKALTSESGNKQNGSFAAGCSQYVVGTRNRRNSDWFIESWQGLLTGDDGEPLAFIVNPKGTSIQHFAAYPAKLVDPMIKASTSERGCCAVCGTQWVRIISTPQPADGKGSGNKERKFRDQFGGNPDRQTHSGFGIPYDPSTVKTVGWRPTCDCAGLETIPATVLDPFSGTSTTGMVASALGRNSILCELNPQYHEISKVRDSQGALAIL